MIVRFLISLFLIIFGWIFIGVAVLPLPWGTFIILLIGILFIMFGGIILAMGDD